MATSHEKVHAALDEFAAMNIDGPMAMLHTTAVMAMPMLDGLLPEDPAELDAMLTYAGAWVLGLRSDPTPELQPGAAGEWVLGLRSDPTPELQPGAAAELTRDTPLEAGA